MHTGCILTHGKDVRAVCISHKAPYNFRGIHYTKLAPSEDLLTRFANGLSWDGYVDTYQRMLKHLDAAEVVGEICQLTGLELEGEMSPILECWEPGNKVECHRHLVANWLKDELGFKIKELPKNAEIFFDFDRYPEIRKNADRLRILYMG
jgi:hypothetical protein